MPAIKTSIIRLWLLPWVTGFACSVAAVHAENPSDLLLKQFAQVDSLVAAFANESAHAASDSTRVQAMLADLLHQNGGFAAAAWVGDNGKIVASACYDGMGNAFSDNISRADWYRLALKTGKPYYSPLSQENGHFICIWSRPVYSGGALPFRSCKGVAVAFVNIGECLKNFSAACRHPFELLHDGRLFFHTDDWRSDFKFEEQTCSLMGGVAFTMRYADSQLSGDTSADYADTAAAAAPSGSPAVRGPAAGGIPKSAPPQRRNQGSSGTGGSAVFFGILAFACLGTLIAAGSFLMVRRKKSAGPETADSEIELEITDQERAAVRSAADAGRHENMRSQIERTETEALEKEVRLQLRRELRQKIEKEGLAGAEEEIRREVLELERASLREELRRQLISSEQPVLREEARSAVLGEAMERLRSEVGGQMEMEALQELTRAVKAEVRAENEKSIRRRAFADLEERIRREVEIRERSMLTAQAREELKAEIADELRAREETGPDRPMADVAAAPQEAVVPCQLPAGQAALIRGVLEKIEQSGALSSLATTVGMLKEAQRESPCFNLNAAQTSDMVGYLDNIGNRLAGYVGEMRKALGDVPAASAAPVRDFDGAAEAAVVSVQGKRDAAARQEA